MAIHDMPYRANPSLRFVFNFTGFVLATIAFYDIIQISYTSGEEGFFPLWRVVFFAIFGLSWLSSKNFYAIRSALALFLPWLVALFVISIRAIFIQETEVIMWALRNVIMIVFLVLATSYCMNAGGNRVVYNFLIWFMVYSFIACVYGAIPIIQNGWTWQSARLVKSEFTNGEGLPFNIILFTSCLIFILPWHQKIKFRLFTLAFLIGISVILATRTPIISAAGAIILSELTQFVENRIKIQYSGSIIATIIIIIIISIPFYMATHPTAELTRTTAGRIALWQAALHEWQQHMIFGHSMPLVKGALENVSSSLLFTYNWEMKELMKLESGGYHNLWIQNLSSFGLVGFFATLWTYLNFTYTAIRSRDGAILLAICFLTIIRSTSEYAGLLSTAKSEMDMITSLAFAYGLSKIYLGRTERTQNENIDLRSKAQ